MLRELLAQSLGVPDSAVDDDAPFMSLGLDSLGRSTSSSGSNERRADPARDALLRVPNRTRAGHPSGHGHRVGTGPGAAGFRTGPGAAGIRTGPGAAGSACSRTRRGSRTLRPDTRTVGSPHQQPAASRRPGPRAPADDGPRPLDTHVLGRALAHLADRHGMLRMRVDDSGARPVQSLAAAAPLSTWYEVRACGAEQVAELESALCNQPFDLATEPPVRAVLFVRNQRSPTC
ncbi:phosphopantetheine-binding protein [Streptomyces sp. M10(2022)]